MVTRPCHWESIVVKHTQRKVVVSKNNIHLFWFVYIKLYIGVDMALYIVADQTTIYRFKLHITSLK